MDSSGAFVRFDLADGTDVTVEGSDLRRIYEELWTRSEVPGAISTAARLSHEAHTQPRYRHAVALNPAQGTALRRAVDHCANAAPTLDS